MKSINNQLETMNKWMIIVLGMFSTSFLYGQEEWVIVDPPRGAFTFKSPEIPQYFYDEEQTSTHYWISPDSTINMTTYYIDGRDFDLEGSDYAFQLMATNLINMSNGDLESYQDITEPSGTQGKEIGISFFDQEGQRRFTFVRSFFWLGQALMFEISSTESSLSQLLSYKTQYFNSIIIQYPPDPPK